MGIVLSQAPFVSIYFLMSEATQRMATAPMMAVPSCPRMPPHVMPSCSKSQPPTRPPKRPNTEFMINPKLPPFINLPAQKPARHPIMIDPSSYFFDLLKRNKSRMPLKSFFMIRPMPWVFRDERVKYLSFVWL